MYLYEREDGHDKHSQTEHPEGGRSSFLRRSSRWRRLRRLATVAGGTVKGLPGRAIRSVTSSPDDLLLDVFQLEGTIVRSAEDKIKNKSAEGFCVFLKFQNEGYGDTIRKNHLLIVEKTSQDGAVEDLGVGIVVVVVGEKLVNLGAQDLDGDAHPHHHKKNHKDHDRHSRHCWSLKDLVLFCVQRCTIWDL